jgi:nucleoside 2-deoxyribosyltransferase
MNGKRKTVYLVGQISPKFQETYDWRTRIIEWDEKFFNFINPCANNFNKDIAETKEYAVTKKNRSWGIDVLPSKDYQFVKESDIAIANMNQYDTKKPLIGSFFELAWYFLHPEKTVIGFADDLNSYNCQHPFVQKAVTVWVNDIEEVSMILRKYFITPIIVSNY